MYRPGDVVNGHQLSADGTVWIPLPPPLPYGTAPVPPRKPSKVVWIVAAAVGAVVVLVTGLVGAAFVSAAAVAEGPYTCDDLVPEIIAMSAEDRDINGYELLAISNPVTGSDRQSSELSIPDGDTSTVMLTCRADASWSDGEETRLEYGVEQDIDGAQWLYYEAN
jgi:hypothetical protein